MVRLPATTAGDGLAAVPSVASSRCRLGEAVADTEHRLDVLRSYLLADIFDVRVDRALVRLKRDPAHCVQQLRPSEHAARLAGHCGHDLELTLGQIHALAAE